MKTSGFFFLAMLLLAAGQPGLQAQAPGFGLAVKASTNGLGADAIFNFHPKMGVRLGFERLSLKTDFIFQEDAVDYATNLKFKTGSVSLLFDYYLTEKIFVSAGAGYNLFNVQLDGEAADVLQFGDIQIPKEKIGTFDIAVNPSLKISPYGGIGFGRTLGLKKKVGFAFEMGGFFQGSPDVTINSSGLLSPTSNPDQQQDVKLEKQVSQYKIYPVMKLSVSYRIAGL
jgi:hypothetical protein